MNGSLTAREAWARRSVVSEKGPQSLSILYAGRCNLSCFMCWHNYIEDMNVTIDPVRLDTFLKDAENVYTAGGEPFWITENVNREAGNIHDWIISRHPRIKLTAFTNGTLLTGKMAELVLERYELIIFSLDTLNPRIYEKICGKPMLDTLLANMERLNELKIKKGLGRDDPPYINVNSILMDDTLDGLPDITWKLAELGGREHFISKLWNLLGPEFEEIGVWESLEKSKTPLATEELLKAHQLLIDGRRLKQNKQTLNRIEKVRLRLQEAALSTGIIVEDGSHLLGITPRDKPLPGQPEAVCSKPWTHAHITQNGNVFCCCTNSVPLGNLGKQSFDEIWNGPVIQELRASFIKGEMMGCMEELCDARVDYFGAVDRVQIS